MQAHELAQFNVVEQVRLGHKISTVNCLTIFLQMLHAKWASHVSYSNDVALVDEQTGNIVDYSSGKALEVIPAYTAPY